MKKILVALMALSALAMVGCSKKQAKKNIGIVQQMNHNSLNTISDAIKAQLAALGYNETNSVITFKQGDNDMTTLSQIVEEWRGHRHSDCDKGGEFGSCGGGCGHSRGVRGMQRPGRLKTACEHGKA